MLWFYLKSDFSFPFIEEIIGERPHVKAKLSSVRLPHWLHSREPYEEPECNHGAWPLRFLIKT